MHLLKEGAGSPGTIAVCPTSHSHSEAGSELEPKTSNADRANSPGLWLGPVQFPSGYQPSPHSHSNPIRKPQETSAMWTAIAKPSVHWMLPWWGERVWRLRPTKAGPQAPAPHSVPGSARRGPPCSSAPGRGSLVRVGPHLGLWSGGPVGRRALLQGAQPCLQLGDSLLQILNHCGGTGMLVER